VFPCEIHEQAAQPTLTIRFRAPVHELPKHFGRIYSAIMQYLQTLGAQHTGAAFAAYHNMDLHNLDVEAGFPVSTPLPGQGEIQAGTIPAGTYAICHYTGPYDECAHAYERLRQYVTNKGYEAGDIAYEWYLNGPETPPQDPKTDIVFPVTSVIEHAHK
jgi:effector-binding domain-containing protein